MARPDDKKEFPCPACDADSWLAKKPRYDGFTRTGDSLHCALCGHEFESEAAIPFKNNRAAAVFTEADRPRAVQVFNEDEKGRLCRYCVEYIVNPFLQRCGLHKREVEATDTCPHFSPKPPPEEDEADADSAPPPIFP